MSAEEEAQQAFDEGVRLAEAGDHAAALAASDRALALKPDFPKARLIRGYALAGLRRYEESAASYDKAIELRKGDYPEAWLNRGLALAELGRYEEAAASYDKAMGLRKGDYPEAWLNRGFALAELGRYEESVASYDKAMELRKGDYLEALVNRGEALASLGRYEEAVASYDKAIELRNGDFPEAWDGRTEALRHLENWVKERLPSKLHGEIYDRVAFIEKKLHLFVRDKLQQAFGGEEGQWWPRVPLEIRKKCALRQEMDPRRRPKYNYADLIDLKEIMDKHWKLFEGDLQRVKDKIESKRHLMESLADLYEIRKTAMRPVRGGLTEDDLAFAHQMREVVERLILSV